MSQPSISTSFRWLAAILACAFVLRLGPPGSLGLDHFDEGVYASAGESLLPSQAIDPGIIPYGPPVVAFSIAFFDFLFGGPSDVAAIMPGIFFGTFAAYLAWRLTKSAFGQEPGLAAAGLVATSGMAIAFSRTALTEAAFATVWLFAMLAGARFLNRPGFTSAIGLGFGVGLAQLTKYNGVMTGLIVALTAVLDAVLVPRETRGRSALLTRRIAWGLVAVAIAAAIYFPWFRFVEDHGGYRGLMKHHGGYVDGPERWVPNLRAQLAQSWLFQAQPVAWFCAAAILAMLKRAAETAAKPIDLARVACIAVVPNAALFVGLYSVRRTWTNSDAAGRMIVVWLVTMAVVTPLYHPYARLWLPAHLASMLLAANVLFGPCLRTANGISINSAGPVDRKLAGLALAIFAGITIWSVDITAVAGVRNLPTIWSDRTNLRESIAGQVEAVRQVTARGQSVHLLLNPAGRRAMALEFGNRPPGPGRLVVVEKFANWNSGNGPLLVDLTLLAPDELRSIREVSRGTPEKNPSGEDPERSRRGLITTLDLAPGVALGEPLPQTGIRWLGR